MALGRGSSSTENDEKVSIHLPVFLCSVYLFISLFEEERRSNANVMISKEKVEDL